MSASVKRETGIVSGDRRKTRDEVNERARLIAGGLAALGVKQGNSVGILMRNDIAFLESAYAVMSLGAYAVPINWHFKADEVAYVMGDSGARVRIGHADLLHGLDGVVSADVTMLSLPAPPEIVAANWIDPALSLAARGTIDFDTWLATKAIRRPRSAAAAKHDLYVGDHRTSQRRQALCAHAGAKRIDGSDACAYLRAKTRYSRAAHRSAVSLSAQCIRPARRTAL